MNPLKLAIVVGHDMRSQGAHGVFPLNQSEYQYNCDIAAEMINYAIKMGIDAKPFFRNEAGGIRSAYKHVSKFDPDAVIELHFNSFKNFDVQGSEVLYDPDDDLSNVNEEKFSKIILEKIYVVFDRTIEKHRRGIKDLKKSDRGYFNLHQVFTCPSIIVEPFFGSNVEDCQIAIARKKAYSHYLVQGFLDFMKTVGA